MRKFIFPVLISVLSGALYGLSTRLLFNFGSSAHRVPQFQGSGEIFGLMTLAFIFLVPLGIGIVTLYFLSFELKQSWLCRIFVPWISTLLLLGTAFLIGWEGTICLMIAAPLFFILSSIGGILGGVIFTRLPSQKYVLASFILLPFLVSPVETRFEPPRAIRVVKTDLLIHAPPKVVWKQIAEVPLIQPHEQSSSLFARMGIPKPLEATLSEHRVGGVRKARFERGLQFDEQITEWEPLKKIAFTIRPNTREMLPGTLDEHVMVGGDYFNVLHGEFELEDLKNGTTLLHLRSLHSVSTRFNFYSHLWTDYLMHDVQRYLVRIIQKRCERENSRSEKELIGNSSRQTYNSL